ncbi:baculoviral IAP repeat-containing protein 5-like [Panonychus citri]|uniref:baculoviral IAP repeat-containing protein 5-like n=1 Tax=Panonychus citri TaxID=50023 RepID=UPI0023083586|nr:baculoviral IAP repeat-containing protein 5-like [Panonychus citri]
MERQVTDHTLIFEKNRVKSFTRWPHKSVSLSKENMAKAGWFKCCVNTNDDAVQCFCCLKQLDGWKPDEDPWKEHLDHSPDCEFAKIGLEQDKLTLPQFLVIMEKRSINLVEKKFNDEKHEEKKLLKKLGIYQYIRGDSKSDTDDE